MEMGPHKEKIDPSSILPQLSDMLTVLGKAIFLTSLKRRDELRPHINKSFQLGCSKCTKITTVLFGDDLAKQINNISEVNKISMKVSGSSRDSRSIGIRTDGKTVIFSTRGKKGPLFGFRRGSSGGGRIPYSSPSTSSNKQDKQGQGLNEVLTCVSNLTNRIENWREITTDPWTLTKNVTGNANCNITYRLCNK